MEKHGNSLRLEVTLFSSYSTYLDEQDIWHDMKKNINIFMLHKSLIYIEKNVGIATILGFQSFMNITFLSYEYRPYAILTRGFETH